MWEEQKDDSYKARCQFYSQRWTAIVPSSKGDNTAQIFCPEPIDGVYQHDHPDCSGLYVVNVTSAVQYPSDGNYRRYITRSKLAARTLAQIVNRIYTLSDEANRIIRNG